MRTKLDDQHSVAEGEEAVLVLERFRIRVASQIDAGERRNHDKQRRARHLEVREQALSNLEFVRRMDKLVRPSRSSLKGTVGREARFDGANCGRRANGHRVIARREGAIHVLGALVTNGEALRVHAVLREVLYFHGPEGTEACVERYRRNSDSLIGERFNQICGEVKSCCRRRNGASVLGKNRLIACLVLRLGIAADITRNRREPNLID